MDLLLEEEGPSSAAANVKNSTPHIACRDPLSRIPVLVLGKIVLRQRLARIYETIVSLHDLNDRAAFEEIVQLMTVGVLTVLQLHTVILFRIKSVGFLTSNVELPQIRNL